MKSFKITLQGTNISPPNGKRNIIFKYAIFGGICDRSQEGIQIYPAFALFDFPKIGNLMILDMRKAIKCLKQVPTNILTPKMVSVYILVMNPMVQSVKKSHKKHIQVKGTT